ncbi:hypothetical protein LPB19_16195 [Marinobacter salinisoli]|uniref:Uncharacterized protein n=1 Tax=Marinobacter salinisoli TaxID=2769486 RepID=A0ABX7MQU7_9GAMM|nr:hypothetical protein [Marinobacter salinisoli]QSP94690.1 hypothetical protein LPB19_16195 [Marinobacter salinisoli]
MSIAPAFGPGSYLIAHGGSRQLINGHLKTLNDEVERFEQWRGQNF